MFDLGRVRLIARREWTTRLRQRSFQITTVIQVLVILGVALSPILIARFTGGDADAGTSIAVLDEAGANAADRLGAVLAGGGETISVTGTVRDEAAARAMVEAGEVDGVLAVSRDAAGGLQFALLTDGIEASSAVAQRLNAAAAALAMEDRLVRSGIPAEEARNVLAPVAFAVEEVGEPAADEPDDTSPAEYVVAYLATVLMFIAVVMYGTWIAQGVVEEKSSRIMEIMVNAATPNDLLAGKVIGIMLAGLTQLGPMLLAGGLAFGLQQRIADMVGVDVGRVLDIDFGRLSTTAIGLFLLFFLLGFVLYGALFAGVGSLVSRQEEVNQAIAPMMTFMMIGYFGAFYVLNDPGSTIAQVLAIVPLTSPFVALPHILLADPPVGEVVLSVALLVAAALVAVWTAGRLYRIGVLMYGQRPSWRSLLRMRAMQQVAR